MHLLALYELEIRSIEAALACSPIARARSPKHETLLFSRIARCCGTALRPQAMPCKQVGDQGLGIFPSRPWQKNCRYTNSRSFFKDLNAYYSFSRPLHEDYLFDATKPFPRGYVANETSRHQFEASSFQTRIEPEAATKASVLRLLRSSHQTTTKIGTATFLGCPFYIAISLK